MPTNDPNYETATLADATLWGICAILVRMTHSQGAFLLCREMEDPRLVEPVELVVRHTDDGPDADSILEVSSETMHGALLKLREILLAEARSVRAALKNAIEPAEPAEPAEPGEPGEPSEADGQ